MDAKVMAAAIQLERRLQAIRLEESTLSHDRPRAARNGHAWSEILDAAVGGLRGLTAIAEFERAVIDLQTVEPSLTAALLGEALTMPESSKRAAFVIDNAKPMSSSTAARVLFGASQPTSRQASRQRPHSSSNDSAGVSGQSFLFQKSPSSGIVGMRVPNRQQ